MPIIVTSNKAQTKCLYTQYHSFHILQKKNIIYLIKIHMKLVLVLLPDLDTASDCHNKKVVTHVTELVAAFIESWHNFLPAEVYVVLDPSGKLIWLSEDKVIK